MLKHFPRLKEGLQALGVLKITQQHVNVMQSCFVHEAKMLDATCVEEIFSVRSWSERGSNKHAAEVRTQTYWRDFLQDMEGAIN